MQPREVQQIGFRFYHQPCRWILNPGANYGRRVRMHQLLINFGRDKNLRKKAREHIDSSDENQIIQRTGVGADGLLGHYVILRSLSKSSANSSTSLSRNA